MAKAYTRGARIRCMPRVYSIDGLVPVVHPSAFVHESAVLHGCLVRRGALIGMNAVVNDNAEVGEQAMVAALAFVKAEARIPAGALAAGIPARVLRELTADELQWKQGTMRLYQKLAERSAKTMRRVEALTAAEPGRKRIDIPGAVPLSELKARTQ